MDLSIRSTILFEPLLCSCRQQETKWEYIARRKYTSCIRITKIDCYLSWSITALFFPWLSHCYLIQLLRSDLVFSRIFLSVYIWFSSFSCHFFESYNATNVKRLPIHISFIFLPILIPELWSRFLSFNLGTTDHMTVLSLCILMHTIHMHWTESVREVWKGKYNGTLSQEKTTIHCCDNY